GYKNLTHKNYSKELPEHRGPRRADEAEAHALEALGAQVPGPRVDVEPRRRPPLLVDERVRAGAAGQVVVRVGHDALAVEHVLAAPHDQLPRVVAGPPAHGADHDDLHAAQRGRVGVQPERLLEITPRHAPRQPRDAPLRLRAHVDDDHLGVVLFAQRDELVRREDGHVEGAAVVLCLPDDGAVALRHAVVIVVVAVITAQHGAATSCKRRRWQALRGGIASCVLVECSESRRLHGSDDAWNNVFLYNGACAV
ncbi:unnamed protein product, partial [Pelagomonas calceolata]